MARTKRIRETVVKLLLNKGPQNSRQIYEHVNDELRWGATMQQLGNILAKNSKIVKLNTERIGSFTGRYDICIWNLSDLERQKLEGNSNDNNKV